MMKQDNVQFNCTNQSNGEKLIAFLEAERNRISPLLVLTHDYPDPDALASSYALQHLATRMFGIRTRIVYTGSIGRSENKKMVRELHLPIHRLAPTDFKKHNGIALVDTQPAFQNNARPSGKSVTIILDHHRPIRRPSADLVIVDPEAGATSVLLAEAILTSNIEMPTNLATALAYGILSDTLNLYRNSQPRTIRAYLAVLAISDLSALARIQYPTRPRRFFESFITGLGQAVVHHQLIVSHLGNVDSPDIVAHMAEFLLTYKNVQWSFCTGRIQETLYMSLRTNNRNADATKTLRGVLDDPRQAGGYGEVAGGQIKISRYRKEADAVSLEKLLVRKLTKLLRVPGAKRSISLLSPK